MSTITAMMLLRSGRSWMAGQGQDPQAEGQPKPANDRFAECASVRWQAGFGRVPSDCRGCRLWPVAEVE